MRHSAHPGHEHQAPQLRLELGTYCLGAILLPGRGAELSIELRNAGTVSARNPVVVVVFVGMIFSDPINLAGLQIPENVTGDGSGMASVGRSMSARGSRCRH